MAFDLSGICDCCCRGWYCCRVTKQVRYAANCAERAAFPVCEATCDGCWPVKPGDFPAHITMTFPTYGVTLGPIPLVNLVVAAHYVTGPQRPPMPYVTGVESLTVDLCRSALVATFSALAYGPYTGLWQLTIETCHPFRATASTALGTVIVEEV